MTSHRVALEEDRGFYIHFSDLADGLGVSSLPSPLCALLLLSFLGVWTLLCMREEEREDVGRGIMGEES